MNIRQSSKKVRFVLNEVKNLNVNDALAKLTFMNKKAAVSISKTISSAVANMAHNNESFDADNIYITTAFVDDHVIVSSTIVSNIAVVPLYTSAHTAIVVESLFVLIHPLFVFLTPQILHRIVFTDPPEPKP